MCGIERKGCRTHGLTQGPDCSKINNRAHPSVAFRFFARDNRAGFPSMGRENKLRGSRSPKVETSLLDFWGRLRRFGSLCVGQVGLAWITWVSKLLV